MLPAYPIYAPNETPWLPSLPADWEVKPVKSVYREVDDRSEEGTEELLSVSAYYGVAPRRERIGEDEHISRAESLEGYKRCAPGDLVMNIMLAWNRGLGVTDYAGIVSPAYSVFRPKVSDLESRYFHYLLRTDLYTGAFKQNSTGVIDSRLRLYPDVFRRMPLVLPPLSTQRAIAEFLDRETIRIDTMISKQERLIEVLLEKRQALITKAVTKGLDSTVPMKGSGVDWLGDVPAHWEVARLKHVAMVRGGVAKGRNLGDSPTVTLPYLRVANVQDGYIDLTEVAEIEVAVSEVERYSLRKGDVLMNEGGDNDKLGRGDVWNGEIHPCLHQNHVFAVRPSRIVSEWLALLTSSDYAKRFFESRAKQTTNLASISSSNLSELPVLLPPELEQRELLTEVAERLAPLESAVSRAKAMVELAKEHRSALIAAAVTGKIDVREVAS